MSVRDRRRYGRIAIATALMVASVFVIGRAVRDANAPAVVPLIGDGGAPSLPIDAERFTRERRARVAADTAPAARTPRTLREFYARRAYPGAPPVIPHPLPDPAAFGGGTCLGCHGEGGWVPALAAYAPVTPHPALVSCVQCHVATSGEGPFVESTFEAVPPPPRGRAALPGSPPPVPHGLQMRENCLACHAGPAAVREIRVTHPERPNCRQCHVSMSGDVPFTREVEYP